MVKDLRQFLTAHNILTGDELQQLSRDYPGMTPLAAAVQRGIFSSEVARDIEESAATGPANGGIEIPGILILSVLGKGARGTVYRAWQEELRRVVAVKTLQREFLKTKEEKGRFIREARIAARLSHPALMRAYDIGSEKDFVYIVLEYVEGETLQQRLRKDGKLSVEETITIAHGIAEGLAFAAEKGIAHRDIKPANIQILASGSVKILDLGLARPAGESELTQPLKVHGTPAYVSPEQARGARQLTPKADVYSLGVLMFRCLSGRHPFQAENQTDMLLSHIEKPAPELKDHVRGVPQPLADLISSMLRKRPNQRPSAESVAIQLRQMQLNLESGKLNRSERKPKTRSSRLPATQPEEPAKAKQLSVVLLIPVIIISALVGAGIVWLASDDPDAIRQDLKDSKEKAKEREAAYQRALQIQRALLDKKGIEDAIPEAPSGSTEERILKDLEENKKLFGD